MTAGDQATLSAAVQFSARRPASMRWMAGLGPVIHVFLP
jgi:hypothetical protein